MEIKKKFFCGIPIYNPTEKQIANIEIYARIFSKLYIYDNSDNIEKYYLKTLEENPGISYISTGNNDGLSRAYNEMCGAALKDGADYLAIYDQDTEPSEKYIRILMDYIERDTKSVAVYGPKIIKSDGEKAEDKAVEVDVLISSGSFLNLDIYKKTPGFDEALFIDNVDDDYCLAARKLGFKIIEVRRALLLHKIGEHKKFLWKIIEEHSPLRMYYIIRNTLYLYKKYDMGKLKSLGWFLGKIRHVALYESEKLSKLKMMIKGAGDFCRGKMGKYEK